MSTPQDKERARELIDEWDAGDGILVDKVASALARVRRERDAFWREALKKYAGPRGITAFWCGACNYERRLFECDCAVGAPLRSLMEQAAAPQEGEPDAAPQPPAAAEWLIWSFEHDAWWAPNERGYKTSIREAGRYSRQSAEEIVRNANYGGGIREAMLPDPISRAAEPKAEEGETR